MPNAYHSAANLRYYLFHRFITSPFIVEEIAALPYQPKYILDELIEQKTPLKSFIIACLLHLKWAEKSDENSILKSLVHSHGCFWYWLQTPVDYELRLSEILNEIKGLKHKCIYSLNRVSNHCIHFDLDKTVFTSEYKRNVITMMRLKGFI